MSTPAFIVGTGRCGSTMLSNMLREHPKLLSLSEVLIMVSDGGTRFPEMFLLTLRYEDILSDPKRQLDIMVRHIGEDYADEDWSARCATTVRPRTTCRDLPEHEAHALTEACRPGFERLREAGIAYEM